MSIETPADRAVMNERADPSGVLNSGENTSTPYQGDGDERPEEVAVENERADPPREPAT